MLSFCVNTSRRDSHTPATLSEAAVACVYACTAVRQFLPQGRAPAAIGDHRPRRGVFFRAGRVAIGLTAAACIFTAQASAQDHVNRPVKKQWRVVGSQPDSLSVQLESELAQRSEPKNDFAIEQANHAFVTSDGVTVHESALPITAYLDGSHEFATDVCDCSSFADQSDRGCGNWISVEYLNWTTTGGDIPPLVRSSPDGVLPQQTAVIGQPGNTLFGGGSDDFTESGIRIGGGWWFDDCHTRGIEIFYSGLPQAREVARFDSNTFPRLGRPVFDTALGVEAAMLIAHPDFLVGTVGVDQSSEFHHVELLRRDMQFQNSCRRIDSLIGLRYASLEDSLLISQSSTYTAAQGQIIAGTQRNLFDRFEASNRFQGLVLGLDYTETIGVFGLHARGTLGIGNNRTEVIIDGQTFTSVPGGGGTATFDGGLLAQTTNIGTHSRNRFIVMPEAFLGISARFNYGWEIKAGYQLIYWSEAAQSVNQIDRRVSQFPPEPPAGVGAPAVLMDSDGVLIHGLQTGLSLTF